MNEKRAYKSALRAEQAQQTRARIVDALIEQLAQTGRQDFAMNEVATRAGVSVRTIYRHFPKREELFDAIADEIDRRSASGIPETVDALRAHVSELLEFFEDNPALLEASHVTGIGREVRQHARRRRGAMARELTERWLAPLPERERVRTWGAMRAVISSNTWRSLRVESQLGAADAKAAYQWVVGLMIDDLERRVAEAEGEEE